MARRSGRGNKRRASPSAIRVHTPAAMPHLVGPSTPSSISALPPLARSSSSSSCASASALSRETSDGSLDDIAHILTAHNSGNSLTSNNSNSNSHTRLVRTRSGSSFVSTKAHAIAPPAFLQVLHDANAPVIGVNVDGVVTLWNKKVETITGFEASEVVGQPLQDYIVGASRRDAVERSIQLAFQDRTSTLEVNIPLRTVSGRNALIVTSVTPLLSEDGTPLGVYGIGQDVTERRIHETHYANVIMQANAPIIELDQDANISVWNAKTESLTGFVDVLGQPLLPMVDEHFRSEVSRQIQQTLTGVAGGDFELPLITSSGSRLEIAVCLTPRVDATGAVVGVVAIGQDVTERNAKEMEYRKFIDSANAPIFGVDLYGSVVIFNKKAAETSEYNADQVMGVNLIDTLISEEYRATVASVFQKAFEGVETANIEFPLVTKSGRKVEILLNATPRYDHLGNLCGAIGIGQDITDRIIQEQEYSRLIDTANAPIFGVDHDGDVIIWNRKAANVTQYSSEEMMGEGLVQYISAEHRNVVQEVLKKALNGVETANFEFSLVTKSGRRLDILLNATPKYDHCGNVCGVVGIGQDISDRRTQEQEYTRLIDTANAPIFGVDKEGRVNIWNRKAAQITEYSVFDVLGANLVENFIPQEFKQEVGAVLSSALEGVETANFEFPLITRTGRRVEILLNATPRHDEKGAIIGVVGIGQDITVRIAQEQEYSRLIDTANAPIFGVDMKGLVNIWNKKAAEITQFSIDEVIGQDLVNGFVSEENRAAVGFALRKALQGAQTANFDFPLITKTGRKVEILLNATPRYNELGNIVGVVGIGQDITERIAQEQEYTRLIDTANAPIFGVNEEGRVNIWNKKAAEITQYTPSDVMGENLVEKFITEDYREAVGYVLSKALNGIETANFEFPLITKTGRRVEILLNATPRFNEHGEVMGMVGIGQDITDRIAQEQEYTRLIDTANAPIFGVDAEGKVNIWNKKAAEITQYTPSDVMGENLVEKFITEDYRHAVAQVLTKALDGLETANFEFPLITKTGRRVEILLNATPRFNEHGEVMGMVGIGQDITDRIAQEQEYTRLIDTANAPIFGVDAEGKVNIWNKKAAGITQYTTSDVMGERLVDKFITKDYREAVGYVLSKALNGIETANFEFPLITKTGRRVEILLNATPRFNEHGEVIGMVGIGQDITDRIAQEQEYTRLIDTANAPIFGVDAEGKVNIWNKKAAGITQYTASDVMGERLVDKFITKDYREAVGRVLSKALNGIETANFEFPLATKAGRRVEILLNATPRFNEHGDVMGMVGIGQDITERIAQEQEYTRLIDKANAPIFGVDVKGCVNIWNRKAAEITQYSPDEVIGEDLVRKFISEEYRSAVAEVLSRALRGDESANFEVPLNTKTGRKVMFLLNATARFDQHGTIVGVVAIGQDITDRIAQEQEYTRLIDTANAPIFGVDVKGCVNIWNKKAAEITQYTPSDVMGENLVEKFITEDYREAVAQVLTKALDGLETANFEFPLITKTGRRVEILLNATSRFNEHGAVIGMVGIGQDITDRIAQEQEYSRLIDTANAPIFGVDANMCVTIWNKKAAQITNYSIHEVMGENLVETFISPEFRPLVAEVLSKALQGIQTANFEFPLITRPGTRIEILLNATPRMDSNGNITGVVGIGQDITDRIAQEHEYFRLIQTANAPIFGVDTNGCINEWNQKIEEITGYHKTSVLGISLVNTVIIPESRLQVGQLLNQALIGIDVGEMELPMTTKKGTFLLLLVNASSKKDMHGNIRGVIGVGQDYTARKHMEAAKVNFLASFSHELRTPLNGVLGMLELLKERKLDSESERYVHIGYVSGSLLLNLINDILDLSKIEAGHMEISSAPFHMQDLLDYSIEIFNLKARERGLHLEQKCDYDVPKIVVGDVFRLRQVLLNLLSNAVKFTNSGSIIVTCSKVKSTDLPVGYMKLLFQVADTGIGMDAEEKSRLFSLFTKLERTRQNNPTGSGLGLAICKQLVELMDGAIDVESELGVGSNFYFTVVVQVADDEHTRKSSLFGSDDLVIPSTALLPNSVDSVSSAVAINSIDSSSSIPSGPLVVVPAKARILVVEDNDFNWEVFKCFLQEDDHLLQWEVNGRNAVNAYIQNHTVYDLVFMDCEMPVMDGYSATTMIRQFEQEKGLPRIPILGLTAYAMNGDRQKCLDAGMDEFMVKPISKSALRRAIRQWMKVRYLGAQELSTSATSRTLTLSPATSTSPSEPVRIPSNTPSRDSFVEGTPAYPSDESALSGSVVASEKVPSALVTPKKSTRLAPASQHMQQLDLSRAIANLELDDPMAVNRRGGRSVRTAVPSTSIFSLGAPLSTSHARSSSGSLLTFQRDSSGAIVEVPEWNQPKDKTSNTLPTGKSSPLYHPDLSEQITVKRASYPKTPMIWTQQMMMPPTSPISVKLPARLANGVGNRASGSITDDEHDGDDDDDGDDAGDHYREMPSFSLVGGINVGGGPPRRSTADSVSPMDIDIPEGDPVNYALGVEQCGEREELFLDLLEKFSMGSEAAMARIEDAYARKELDVLKRETHSLKGSSAYVAALRVSKSAYRVQLAAERLIDSKAATLSDPAPLVAMVDSTMGALRKEHKLLRGYIRRNFAFRSSRGGTLVKDDRSGGRDKPANACAVM